MLELAYLNQGPLRELYTRAIMDEKNKYYYFNRVYRYDLEIDNSEWHRLQYVSKSEEGELLWYIGAYVNRMNNTIENGEILNLTDKPSLEGARDMIRFLEYIFCKRNFRKMTFYVTKDNPYKEGYLRLILKRKIGRIVGELKEHCILSDGRVYDQLLCEILKSDFEKSNYRDYL